MINLLEKKYTCGSLKYSMLSLGGVLLLLMLGFASFNFAVTTVMQAVPLQLKHLGASAKTIAFIMTTIGGVFNMTVCPIVSFRSDRYRSKWGRRIPFILWTLPMFAGAIFLFGNSGTIASWIMPFIQHWGEVSPATLTITVMAVVMMLYQFFFMFVGSVIFYIYNDVIPTQFLARVVGIMQVGNALVSALFNFFIFKYSVSHFRWVMIGASIVYTAGMLTMCLLLKETEHPPLKEEEKKASRGLRGVMTFLRESFSHPYYVCNFIGGSLIAVSGAIGTFEVFFNQNMGLTLDLLGKVNGFGGLLSTIMSMSAAIFFTVFIDRWHPVRVSFFMTLFMILPILLNLKWLLVTPPVEVFFMLNLLNAAIFLLLTLIKGLAGLPSLMRTFPKSRFGQFCSAQSLLRSILMLIFGYIAGVYVDLLRVNLGFGEIAFRWIYCWQFCWYALGLFFLIKMYRWWHKLGGDENYRAPAAWLPEGFETMPSSPTPLPKKKLLNLALIMLDCFFTLMLAGAIFFCATALHNGLALETQKYICRALPCASAAIAVWLWVRLGIRRDIRRALHGEAPVNGLPHHGILLILAIRQTGIIVSNVYQSCATLKLNSGISADLWAQESIIALIVALIVWGITKIEKGYAVRIAESGEA